MPDRPLRDVLAAHAGRLLGIPGVAGVGEGATADGTPCLLVLVEADTEALRAALPAAIDGHPVEIEETGAFEARDADEDDEDADA